MADAYSRGDGDRAIAFGTYELVRSLRTGRLAERFLVFDTHRSSHHVAFRYRFDASSAQERAEALDAIDAASRIACGHILPIEQFGMAGEDQVWIISPYLGDHDGLLLLSDLMADKGGQLEPTESLRVMKQLLDASKTGQASGRLHGRLALNDVHVDRSGCVLVELYGLSSIRALTGQALSDELASIAMIGYRLLTGVLPEETLIEPSKLIGTIDASWDRFFVSALDPAAGFATIEGFEAAIGELGAPKAPAAPAAAPRSTIASRLIRRRSEV